MKNKVLVLSLFFSISLCLFSEGNKSNVINEGSSVQVDPWVKQIGLQYSMPILARTYKNGSLFQPTGSLLGVFKDNLCWGYGGLGNSPVGKLFNITMGYNTNNVSGFSYKLYDPTTGKIYDIVESVTFKSNVPVGAINTPVSLNLKFNITASSSDVNKGTVSGAVGAFTSGQAVSLVATPLAGFHFLNWTDGVGGTVVSTEASYSFNANESLNLVANFQVASLTQVSAVSEMSVNVFPNPASNYFEIKFNSITSDNTTIEVCNLQGMIVKQVFSGSFIGEKVFVVERNNAFSNGLYFLRINNGATKYVQKIVFK